MAIGVGGNAIVWNGTGWSAPRAIEKGQGGLSEVSCASAKFCMAGDQGGSFLLWNGTSWSAPQTIDASARSNTSPGFESVSYASASFCVAVFQGRAVIGRRRG
jgi:hypothetical protein